MTAKTISHHAMLKRDELDMTRNRKYKLIKVGKFLTTASTMAITGVLVNTNFVSADVQNATGSKNSDASVTEVSSSKVSDVSGDNLDASSNTTGDHSEVVVKAGTDTTVTKSSETSANSTSSSENSSQTNSETVNTSETSSTASTSESSSTASSQQSSSQSQEADKASSLHVEASNFSSIAASAQSAIDSMAIEDGNANKAAGFVSNDAFVALGQHQETESSVVADNVKKADEYMAKGDNEAASSLIVATAGIIATMNQEIQLAAAMVEEDSFGADANVKARADEALNKLPNIDKIKYQTDAYGDLIVSVDKSAGLGAYNDAIAAITKAGLSSNFRNIVDPIVGDGLNGGTITDPSGISITLSGSRNNSTAANINWGSEGSAQQIEQGFNPTLTITPTPGSKLTQENMEDMLVNDNGLSFNSGNVQVTGQDVRTGASKDAYLSAAGANTGDNNAVVADWQTGTVIHLGQVGTTVSGKAISADIKITGVNGGSGLSALPNTGSFWFVGAGGISYNGVGLSSDLEWYVDGKPATLVTMDMITDLDQGQSVQYQTGVPTAVLAGSALTYDASTQTYNGGLQTGGGKTAGAQAFVSVTVGTHIGMSFVEYNGSATYGIQSYGNLSQTIRNISYPQKLQVQYYDDTTKTYLSDDQVKSMGLSNEINGLSGESGTVVLPIPKNYEVSWANHGQLVADKGTVKNGYELVGSGLSTDTSGINATSKPLSVNKNYYETTGTSKLAYTFDNNEDSQGDTQKVIVHLVHATEDGVATNNYTVNYKTSDGSKLPAYVHSVTQSVNWTDSHDLLTDTHVYTPDYDIVNTTSPKVPGYVADQEAVTSGSWNQRSTQTVLPSNEVKLVTYTPATAKVIVKYLDDTTGGTQVGTTQTIDTITNGKGSYTVVNPDPSKWVISDMVSEPVQLLYGTSADGVGSMTTDGQNFGSKISYVGSDGVGGVQEIDIHLSHKNNVTEFAKTQYVVDYKFGDVGSSLTGTTAAPSHTMNVVWTKTIDEVTGAITLSPNTSQFESAVPSPEIKGFTPDSNQSSFTQPIAVTFPKGTPDSNIVAALQNEHILVQYDGDHQSANVHFVDVNSKYMGDGNGNDPKGQKDGFDEKDGNELTAYQDTLTGITSQGLQTSVQDKIKALEDKGYKVIETSAGAQTNGAINLTFDNDDATNQNVVFYVIHDGGPVTKDDVPGPNLPDKNGNVSVSTEIDYVYGANAGDKAGQQAANPSIENSVMNGWKDKVTGDIDWNPASVKTADVKSPIIKGYTPSESVVSGREVTPSSNNSKKTVTYFADDQKANITYHDEDSNNPHDNIPGQVITGSTGEHKTVTLTPPDGYVIDPSNLPSDGKYNPDDKSWTFDMDDDDNVDQNFNFGLKHDYQNAKTGQPGVPDGVELDADGNKVITRTVHYLSTTGVTLAPDVVQTVVYHGIYDPVEKMTKFVVYRDMTTLTTIPNSVKSVTSDTKNEIAYGLGDDGLTSGMEMNDVPSPFIKGHNASQSQVTNYATILTTPSQDEVVTYDGYKDSTMFVYYDDVTGKIIPETEQMFSGDEGQKFVNQSLDFDISKNHYSYVDTTDGSAAGNVVTDVVNSDGTKATFVTGSHVYYIHLTHQYIPAKNGDTGLPEGVTPDEKGNYEVTRTIKVVNENGDTLFSIPQKVQFNAQLDLTTGTVSYTPSEGMFEAYTVPEMNGYTADKSSVEAMKVTPDTKSSEVVITEIAQGQKAEISYEDESGNKIDLSSKTQNIAGKTGSQASVGLWDFASAGFMIDEDKAKANGLSLSDNGKTLNFAYDTDTSNTQKFVIPLKHVIRGAVTGDKGLPDGMTLDSNHNHVVSRTVNYVDANGKVVSPKYVEQVAYHATIDVALGKVSWTVDKANSVDSQTLTPTLISSDSMESTFNRGIVGGSLQDSLNEVSVPTLSGMKLISSDASVSDLKVSLGRDNAVVNVVYAEQGATGSEVSSVVDSAGASQSSNNSNASGTENLATAQQDAQYFIDLASTATYTTPNVDKAIAVLKAMLSNSDVTAQMIMDELNANKPALMQINYAIKGAGTPIANSDFIMGTVSDTVAAGDDPNAGFKIPLKNIPGYKFANTINNGSTEFKTASGKTIKVVIGEGGAYIEDDMESINLTMDYVVDNTSGTSQAGSNSSQGSAAHSNANSLPVDNTSGDNKGDTGNPVVDTTVTQHFIDSTTGKEVEVLAQTKAGTPGSDYKFELPDFAALGYGDDTSKASDQDSLTGKFGNKNSDIYHYLVEKEVPATSKDEGVPSNVDDKTGIAEVTQTVNFVDENGNKISDSNIQTASFKYMKNLVTGKIIMTVVKNNFVEVNAPKVDGYQLLTPSYATIKPVNGLTAMSESSVINVPYHQIKTIWNDQSGKEIKSVVGTAVVGDVDGYVLVNTKQTAKGDTVYTMEAVDKATPGSDKTIENGNDNTGSQNNGGATKAAVNDSPSTKATMLPNSDTGVQAAGIGGAGGTSQATLPDTGMTDSWFLVEEVVGALTLAGAAVVGKKNK